jgi:hypothetical protein
VTFGDTVEYLVVGGGGGGGNQGAAGGGGAGGLRTNLSGHPLSGSAFPVSTSPGSYTVTVGGGGARGIMLVVAAAAELQVLQELVELVVEVVEMLQLVQIHHLMEPMLRVAVEEEDNQVVELVVPVVPVS